MDKYLVVIIVLIFLSLGIILYIRYLQKDPIKEEDPNHLMSGDDFTILE